MEVNPLDDQLQPKGLPAPMDPLQGEARDRFVDSDPDVILLSELLEVGTNALSHKE